MILSYSCSQVRIFLSSGRNSGQEVAQETTLCFDNDNRFRKRLVEGGLNATRHKLEKGEVAWRQLL
jgi:hypothetical protein